MGLGLYPTGNATVLLPRQIGWVHAQDLLLTLAQRLVADLVARYSRENLSTFFARKFIASEVEPLSEYAFSPINQSRHEFADVPYTDLLQYSICWISARMRPRRSSDFCYARSNTVARLTAALRSASTASSC